MRIDVALLIFYIVTSIIGALYISWRWFYSILNGSSLEREPRWMKVLEGYCTPTGIAFMLLYFLVNGGRKLVIFRFHRRGRPRTGIPFRMVGVLQKNALAIEGVQPTLIPKFVGVQAGEFILLPDSSSETRPNDLRVIGPKTLLLVQGVSDSLRVRTEEGLSYFSFQDQLSEEDKIILRKLASDLTGWVWPDVGEILQRRIKELGEDNVLRALRHLFDGTERTMRRRRIPLIGSRLIS